jgi:hypothetical protein
MCISGEVYACNLAGNCAAGSCVRCVATLQREMAVLEKLVELEVTEEGVMELAEKEAMEEDLGVKGAVLEGAAAVMEGLRR